MRVWTRIIGVLFLSSGCASWLPAADFISHTNGGWRELEQINPNPPPNVHQTKVWRTLPGVFPGPSDSATINAGHLVTIPVAESVAGLVLSGSLGLQDQLFSVLASGVVVNATIQGGVTAGKFENHGSMAADGSLHLADTPFENEAGATFDIRTDGSVTAYGGGFGRGAFINYGTLRKSGGTGSSFLCRGNNVGFQNLGGVIEVLSGTLLIGGVRASTDGTLNISAGATLDLGASDVPKYNGSWTGTGQGVVTMSNVNNTIQAGTDGNPVQFTFPSNLFRWRGGRIQVYNRLVNDGWLTVEGDDTKTLSGAPGITNAGTVIHADAGNLHLDESVFMNGPDALFEFRDDGDVTAYYSGSGTARFLNYGRVLKSGGTGVSFIQRFRSLGGTLEARSGTLALRENSAGATEDPRFLVASGAAVDLTGGEIGHYQGRFTGAGEGTVLLTNGTLVTSGLALVFTNDLFRWKGGIVEGAVSNIGRVWTEGIHAKDLKGSFLNQGQWYHRGQGDFHLNETVFSNAPGALFDILEDGRMTHYSGWKGLTVFRNQGLLRKSGGTGTFTVMRFQSLGGMIDVQSGRLALREDGASTGSVSGHLSVAAGAVLDLTDGLNSRYYGTWTGSGAGQVVLSNGTMTVAGTALNFPGDLFRWQGGILSGSATNVNAIRLEGASTKELKGDFINAGTMVYRGPGGLHLNETVFTNQGLFEIQEDGLMTHYSGYMGRTAFRNTGTFRKSGGAGTFVVERFQNTGGTVEAMSGTLQFNGGYVQQGGTTRLAGGNLAATAPITINSGMLWGTGVISGPVESSGAIIVVNELRVAGNYTQKAQGTLDVEIGGRVPVSQYERLAVSGSAVLDGTLGLHVTNGFKPMPGDSFPIVTRASGSGSFTNLYLYWSAQLTNGLQWRLTYLPTAVVASVVGTVQFNSQSVSLSEKKPSVTVKVNRAGSVAGALSVPFTTRDGTARAGFEYTATSGTVVFAAGVTNAVITVPILNNGYHELAKSFTVALSAPTGYWALGTASNTTVTIADDEPSAAAALPLWDAFAGAAPSNHWTFYSSRSGRVQVATNAGPRSGSRHLTLDCTAFNSAGSLNEAILTVNLAGRTNVWLSFYQKEFADDDNPMAATFTGHTNADGVAVSADGTNWFRVVSLTGGASGNGYRRFYARLDDVAASNGIPLNAAFTIKFQEFGNNAIPSDGMAFDDVAVYVPAGTVQFSAAAYQASESAGACTVTVTRSTVAGACSAGYAALSGTARSGVDFGAATGTLSFGGTRLNASFAVAITNNAWDNEDATVRLVLGDLTGWYVPGAVTSAVLTLLDDEALVPAVPDLVEPFTNPAFGAYWTLSSGIDGRIRIVTNNGPRSAGGHLTLDVSRFSSAGCLNEATLTLDLQGRTNVWLGFYEKESGEDDHPMAASFTGHANADGVAVSADGTNWVRLVSLTGSASGSAWRQYLFRLDDVAASNGLSLDGLFKVRFQEFGRDSIPADGLAFDDIAVFIPAGTVQFASASATVAEDAGAVEVGLTRSSGAGTARVDVATMDGSARAGFEYAAFTGTVTFAEGETTASVFVPIIDNVHDNDASAFTVRMLNVEDLYAPGAPTSMGVEVADDEMTVAAPFPFYDGFESGVLANWWGLYVGGGARLQVVSNAAAHGGAHHLVMDNAGLGVPGPNEAVLTFDLAGRSNVWVSFWQREYNDSDNAMPASFAGRVNADGVAASADGTNWFRLVGLTGAASGNGYRQTFVRLDDAAASNGVAFTDRFQVKFQQYGWYAASANAGGFAFDDIAVFTPEGTLQFEAGTNAVAENAGEARVTVTRSSGTGSAGFRYATADLTARADSEYEAAYGLVMFEDGVTEATLVVPVFDNRHANETLALRLVLTDFLGTVIPGSPTNAVLAIVDDEVPAAADFPVVEDFESGSLTNWWTVHGSGAGRSRITGSYGPFGAGHLMMDSMAWGSAGLNEAVLAVNLAGRSNVWLSFSQKEFSDSDQAMAATFAGHAHADGVAVSPDGTNWHRVVSLTGAVSGSGYRRHVIRLDELAAASGFAFTDAFRIKFQQYGSYTYSSGGCVFDDIAVHQPAGTIQFSTNVFAVAENGTSVTVVVTRTNGNTGVLSVEYATSDGTALAGSDFVAVTGSLAWADGDMDPKVVAIPILDNAFWESNETFSINLAGDGLGAVSNAAVTIVENEAPVAPKRINCGGKAVGGWSKDSGCLRGEAVTALAKVKNNGTVPMAVYKTYRRGPSIKFQYKAVPDGDYRVTLYFAEHEVRAKGKRRFNMAINGTGVLTGFDVFRAAGNWRTAVVRTFTVPVRNGKGITIAGTGLNGASAILCGVEIVPDLAGDPPAPAAAPAAAQAERLMSGGEPAGVQAWASSEFSSRYPAGAAVDGDPETAWVGADGGAPWSLTLDLGRVVEVDGLEVLFEEPGWAGWSVVGSGDLATWFDLGNATPPVALRYLYLNFAEDPDASEPPAVREIMVEEAP